MGKIVMPKHSALMEEIEPTLKIYYEVGDWLHNDDFKKKLKQAIGDHQYKSSYTKKMQVLSYFGFIEWEDIKRNRSRRRITENGKKLYDAMKNDDVYRIWDLLVNALENVKFGRDNFGCPDSDSDIEPPNVLIRSILDIGNLTSAEFGFLLWKLEDEGGNYTDTINELKYFRENNISITVNEIIRKYKDWKPILIMVRWNFLLEHNSEGRETSLVINPDVIKKFGKRLRNLKIYNVDMDVIAEDEVVRPKKIIKPFLISETYIANFEHGNMTIEMDKVNEQEIEIGDSVLFVDREIKRLLAYNVYYINSMKQKGNEYNIEIEKRQLVNQDKEMDIIQELKKEETE